MMSDTLYRWHTNGNWTYNHGVDGPAVHEPNVGSFAVGYGPPRIKGNNRLYGDGSVRWMNGNEYDTEGMQNLDPTTHWVRSGLDHNFY